MKQYVKNTAITWGAYGFNIVLALVLTPFVLSHLGEQKYGLWITCLSVAGFYKLMDIGFRPGIIRNLSSAISRADREEIVRTASSGIVVMSAVGMLVLVVSCSISPYLPSILSLNSEDASSFGNAILILGIGIGLQFPLLVFDSALSAAERFDISRYLAVLSRATYAILVVTALESGGGIVSIAAAVTFGNLTGSVLRGFFAFRSIEHFGFKWSGVEPKAMVSFVNFGMWATVSNSSAQLARHSDALVIARFVSSVAVAPYGLAVTLTQHFANVVLPMGMMLFPAATKLAGKGDLVGLRHLYFTATRYVLGVAIGLGFFVHVFARSFFSLWIGDVTAATTLDEACALFNVLIIASVFSASQSVGRQVVLARGNAVLLAMAVIPETVLNLSSSIVLSGYFGVTGVAYGTLFATVIFCSFVYPVIVAKVAEISLWEIFLKTLPRPTFFLAFGLLLVVAIRELHVFPANWLELIVEGIVAVGIIAVAFFLLVLNRQEKRQVISNVRVFLGRDSSVS